jgi:serine phosphatase RsbU (regulator of sigma subunit)
MKPPPVEPLDIFARLAQVLRPDIAQYQGDERANRVNDIVGVLFALPLAVIGLVWLASISDWPSLWQQAPFLLLATGLILLLTRWTFFLIIDMGARGGGTYANVNSSLESVMRWCVMFLFGPTVIWVFLVLEPSVAVLQFRRARYANRRDLLWNTLRGSVISAADLTLIALLCLSAYRAWGGSIPISGVSFENFALGAGVIGLQMLIQLVLLSFSYLGYSLWKMRQQLNLQQLLWIGQLTGLGVLVPAAGNLFAAPLAGVYVDHGLPLFLTFSLPLLAIAWLARRMSRAIEQSRTQTAQIEKLEALGRAILNAPPDNRTLPELLMEHVPPMFVYTRLAIWLDEEPPLLQLPESWDAKELEAVRPWLAENPQALALYTKDALPWNTLDGPASHRPLLLAPVLAVEDGQPFVGGGVYVELSTFGQIHNRAALNLALTTVQSLAAQIASALHQALVYQRTLQQQKTQSELEFARRVQASFLPAELPPAPGWQIVASLEPARQMSGDFYDVIALPAGKLALLVADVADKGIGPALFMALSRTLMRTFAVQHPDLPEQVCALTNQRIIEDAGDNMFVTAFYGVLDPPSGRLTYANAGHNPPLLLRAGSQTPEKLTRTGAALGIMEDLTWQSESVTLHPGDVLVLYTDGVTEAQNAAGELFEDERLLECVRAHAAETAQEIHAAILEAICAFTGDAPQFDDITLVAVRGENL